MHSPLQVLSLRKHSLGRLNPRSATFGRAVRRDPKTGLPRDHQGYDLLARKGTPVFAVADGYAEAHSDCGNGYGNNVFLEFHLEGERYYAFYAHLSKAFGANNGRRWVTEGTTLGLTGTTGWDELARKYPREAHLHFEIRTRKHPGRSLRGRLDSLAFLMNVSRRKAEEDLRKELGSVPHFLRPNSGPDYPSLLTPP